MKCIPTQNLWKLLPILSLALGTAGCGGNSASPTAPPVEENPAPEIKTPASLRITSITVTRFSSTKNNGETWDWDPFSSGPRRADLFVQLELSGRVVYVSDTRTDAEPSGTNTFPGSQRARSGELPASTPYSGSIKIRLYDDDGILGNDSIGQISMDAGSLYSHDNATGLNRTVTGGGCTVKVAGNWIY